MQGSDYFLSRGTYMAFFEMKIHSDALGHGVSVNVIIPQYSETVIGIVTLFGTIQIIRLT